MREFDASILTANPNAHPEASTSTSDSAQAPDQEAAIDIDNDPFASYFTSDRDPSIPPKVLVTTSPKSCRQTYDFCDELVGVFPGAEFIRRKKGKGFEIGRIAGWAAGRGYGTLIVVNEDMKKASMFTLILTSNHFAKNTSDAITVVHLPSGPTAYFKLTSVELTKKIFVGIHSNLVQL